MVTEEPPPNRVLAGAADFGRCSLRRERQFHAVPRHPLLVCTFVTYLPLPHRTTTNLYGVHVLINVN